MTRAHEQADRQIVHQVIRPTGILDPEVEIRPVRGQVDDLIGEIPKVWNWLPDEFGPNKDAKLLHWTLGTPCFHEFAHAPMAEEWHREKLLTDYSLQRVIDGPFEGEDGYGVAEAAE